MVAPVVSREDQMSPKQMRLLVPLTAILCLTLLEVVALLKGIDGKVLVLTVSGIAGVGGFSLSRVLQRPPPE